jgi:hypothetical protein
LLCGSAGQDGRTLFVTNFSSKTLEMIDVARALPGAR